MQGSSIKRVWTQQSQVSDHTDVLDIWDSGSHRYERWPGDNEMYWKIISRDQTDQGFVEVLQKMAPWQMPAQVIHQEQIPLLLLSSREFQAGGWRIEQEPYDIGNPLEEKTIRNRSPPYQQQRQQPQGGPSSQGRQQHSQGSHQHSQRPHQPQRPSQKPYRVQRIASSYQARRDQEPGS